MTMTSTTTAGPAPLSRDAAGALLGQTMGFVALTAGVFAYGAYLGRDLSGGWAICWFLVSLAALLGMSRARERSEHLAVGLLFGFGLALGLAVAPTVGYYVGADPQAVWLAGGATALFVAGFGAAGYATRRDLSTLARSFLWALVALIVFGIVIVFVQIPNGSIVSSAGDSSAVTARVTTSGFHGRDQLQAERESVRVHPATTWHRTSMEPAGRPGPRRVERAGPMTHFTFEQSLGLISSAAAAWLMVRAGVAKHQLVFRPRARCAACRRRLTKGACSCTRHAR